MWSTGRAAGPGQSIKPLLWPCFFSTTHDMLRPWCISRCGQPCILHLQLATHSICWPSMHSIVWVSSCPLQRPVPAVAGTDPSGRSCLLPLVVNSRTSQAQLQVGLDGQWLLKNK